MATVAVSAPMIFTFIGPYTATTKVSVAMVSIPRGHVGTSCSVSCNCLYPSRGPKWQQLLCQLQWFLSQYRPYLTTATVSVAMISIPVEALLGHSCGFYSITGPTWQQLQSQLQ